MWKMLLQCFVIAVCYYQRSRALLEELPAGVAKVSSPVQTGDCTVNSTFMATVALQDVILPSLAVPSLVCQEASSITLTWNQTSGLYYFLQYLQASQPAKLTNLTTCNIQTISNLTVNQPVSVTLYASAYRKRLLQKSDPVVVRLLEASKRTPVRNLSATFNFTGHGYTGIVSWESGSDLSCFYEVVWYGKRQPGDYSQRRLSLKKQPKTQFVLPDLEFGRQYHFAIASIDGKGSLESSKRYLKISVPSCQEAFKNLSICAPSKPTNFTALPLSPSDLKLRWNKPQLLPAFYSIDFLSLNQSANGSFTMSINASGAADSSMLSNISLGEHYLVKLVAHSRAGSSPPAYIRASSPKSNNFTSSVQEENGGFLIWTLIGSAIILALGLVFWKLQQIGRFFHEDRAAEPAVRYTSTEMEDPKWELVESKLLVDRVIGCGAFGIVQKGFYYLEPNKKTPVAIKTLKARPTPEQLDQFYDEIEIMKSVPYHAHIVFLFGVVTKHRPSNPLMLVEYCAKGDLHTFLKNVAFILQASSEIEENLDSKATKFFNKCYDMDMEGFKETFLTLEPKDLLSFGRQIAVGMEFLANLKVIHRDLAARNVLINENNTLKISDFGLSRDIYTDSVYRKVTGGKLPFKWMALESLTHQVYTTESDVWSFGIVLWEIITLGENPYPAVNTEDLVGLLKEGYRMERPINCSEELYETMLECWRSSPNLRPSFRQLRETFDRLLESQVQYINLKGARNSNAKRYENVDPTVGANLDTVSQEQLKFYATLV